MGKIVRNISVAVLCVFLLACVYFCMGAMGFSYVFDVLFTVVFHLVAGWVYYCSRVLPQVQPRAAGILTALVCLGGLVCGAHLFLRWLSREIQESQAVREEGIRRWPARRTSALLALIVLMFVTGISAVGVTHQTAWLVTSPEPLVVDSRSSAPGTQLVNNLKQIALAMAMYSDEKGSLPPAAVWDSEGRALLSWRVLILPYLEYPGTYKDLYNQFHLDEPWDSLSNLRLLSRMPTIYAPLSQPYDREACRTYCQVFTGPNTAFEGRHGLRLKKDFPLPGTFLVVEAARTVPWTKPEDLSYSANQPVPPLGYLKPDEFAAALADGGVTRFPRTEREQIIRAYITRDGNKGKSPDR